MLIITKRKKNTFYYDTKNINYIINIKHDINQFWLIYFHSYLQLIRKYELCNCQMKCLKSVISHISSQFCFATNVVNESCVERDTTRRLDVRMIYRKRMHKFLK